ncbi:hypothetical protein [Caballeronia sp. AZ7_KS35]|uniref:hypothetical protein n=1 Tax=Caballeronia sp. AZ7_KS35 TaxID=2921762 RepID=UPI002028034A|nr:hypothetical protein [Caballeronia sp. AZ7_KS35]
MIQLTNEQAAEITRGSFGIGEAFYLMDEARPELIEDGDGIAFAGFPGDLRRVQAINELNFGSYSCGATPVTSAHDDYLVCQFEREEWIRQGYEAEPAAIGGISGGPAFQICESAAGLMSFAFAGIVYEFSEGFDLLYVTQARAIHDLIGWG